MKLIITRGLPASGKSTRARAWVAEDPRNRAEVNRDHIREMLHGGYADQEQTVTEISHSNIKWLLELGKSVVCSDTNLPQKTVRELARIGWAAGAEVEVWDMTDVPVETCIVRNAQRQDKNPVPVDAITRMYLRFIKGKKYPLPFPEKDAGTVADHYVPQPFKPGIDLADIDGTVALMHNRSPYDYSKVEDDFTNWAVIETIRGRYGQGQNIVFMSGRPEVDNNGFNVRAATQRWLAKNIPFQYKALYMRHAGDNRNDAVVKRELFDAHIRFQYNVGVVFDDRDRVVRMWREELGLTCLQVAAGSFLSDTLRYMATHRECPGCKRKIWYENARSRKRAEDRGTSCHSCSQVERECVNGIWHKKCPKCTSMKPYTAYNKLSRAVDGLQGWCRDCGRAASLSDYYSHKAGYKTRTKQLNENLRERINAEKSKPCADCGQSFDPVCMDFDHLPGFAKEFNITEMLRRRMAWAKVKAEIAKCEVVCSNCHRLRTKYR